jgi:hypothetical protein
MATPATGKLPLRLWVTLVVIVGLAVFVGANAHFFYVAFDSQPECVSHEKLGAADAGRLSAADSSC